MSNHVETVDALSVEDVGSAGPPDRIEDRDSNVASTQMVTLSPDADKNRPPRSKALEPLRFLNWTKKLFSDHIRSSSTFEEVELTPIPYGMALYSVIVDKELIRQYMIKIRRLPRLLREAIGKKLPTGKRMVVVNVQEGDTALMRANRQQIPFRILSSWLRMCETEDAVYFVDVSGVVEENGESDSDEEESSAIKETDPLLKSEDTNLSPDEEPKTSSGVADPKVPEGHLEIATIREMSSTEVVISVDVPEASSKQSCCGLFRR